MTAVPTVLIEGNLSILGAANFGLIPALEVTGPIGSLVACPSRPRALLAAGVPLHFQTTPPCAAHCHTVAGLPGAWPLGFWVSYAQVTSRAPVMGRDMLINTTCAIPDSLVKTPVAPSGPLHVEILRGWEECSFCLSD